MIDTLQPAPAGTNTHDYNPNPENPAVVRCSQALERVYAEARAQRKSPYSVRTEANAAFCKALPPLTGAHNIRDFIACVARGMLLGAIEGQDGPRLLYAAQVANGALKYRSKKARPKPQTTDSQILKPTP